jgi:hypothetical protein
LAKKPQLSAVNLVRKVPEPPPELGEQGRALWHSVMQGEMITSRGLVRSHPLLRDELANRAFAVRAIQRLGLDLEPVKAIGRPPGIA